jgi:hypothetical protein
MWDLIYWFVTLAILAWSLFTPSGRDSWGWFFSNFVGAALKQATPLVTELSADLNLVAKSFSTAMNANGETIAATLGTDFQKLAAYVLQAQRGALATAGLSTPSNALDNAAEAFKVAFGAGLSSASIAALFEAVLPEKLNVLNGAAPMIAKMAGFDEVAAEVLGPLYKNAFGRSLEYQYRSLFKPEYPDEADAVKWHSRGLLTEDQLRVIFEISGLKTEYEAPYIAAAYRPVPPFLLARAAEAGVIPKSDLDSALQFGGFRPADITMLERAYAGLALLPYETRYLQSVERSVELGTDTPASLARSMDLIHLSQQAQGFVQLQVAELKLHNLTELYRKSVSESYKYGTTTDAQYVPSLEAIGIDPAEAQGYYAIDSIAKQGKIMAAALRAEERLANQQRSAAMRAAIAEFHSGTIGAAALEAALLLAGIDPLIASYAVVVQTARQAGPPVLVYGIELGRTAALLLHEKVTALGRQVKARLVTPAEALLTLAGLGIPGANAEALVADWAATHTPASTVGVKEPL